MAEKSNPKIEILNNKNIFYNNNVIEDFYDFIKNKDLENLLDLDDDIKTPVKNVENENNINVIDEFIPPKKQLKEEINTEHQPVKNSKSISKIRNNYELSNLKLFANVVGENEIFLTTFLNNKSTINNEQHTSIIEFSKSANPLNRWTWKTLGISNVESNKYSKQFLDVNGVKILLAGMRGGDIENIKFNPIITVSSKPKRASPKKSPNVNRISVRKISNPDTKKKNRLLSSMYVNFKPGPLSRKPILNEFSAEIGLGDIETVRLPRVGLEIRPQIGIALDSNICKYLKQTRSEDGSVDLAWANFATSVAITKSVSNKTASHTFVIPYDKNRSKILMRKDFDLNENTKSKTVSIKKVHTCLPEEDNYLPNLTRYEPKDDIEYAVKSVLDDLLRTICIGEVPDEFIQTDPDAIKEENTTAKHEDFPDTNVKIPLKKPLKRKFVNELKKLNVNLVDIEPDKVVVETPCLKTWCKMGCVCSTLKSKYVLNEHCGLPECMLECKCDLESEDQDECESRNGCEISTSAVLNINNLINRNLAKEERKFQRTVIRSNDQTIVMGARRRGVRQPKKFEDYRTSLSNEKFDNGIYSEARIVLPKLPNLDKCEPWCMTHKLYRCFCKGLFLKGNEFKYSINEGNYETDITPITLDKDEPKNLPPVEETMTCARTDPNQNISEQIKKKLELYAIRNKNIKAADEEKLVPKKNDQTDSTSNQRIPNKQSLLINSNINASPNNPNLTVIYENNNDKKCSTPDLDSGLNTLKLKNNRIQLECVYKEMNPKQNITFVPKPVAINTTNLIKKVIPQNGNPKVQDPQKNDSTPDMTKDDHHILNVIRSMSEIKNSQCYKFSTTIYPPFPGDTIVVSWITLMGQLLLEKIYVWLTPRYPYKQFITMDDRYYDDTKLVNIAVASKNILKYHPPFVCDIKNAKLAQNTYLMLQGKTLAWQIRAAVTNNNPTVVDKQVSNESHKTSKLYKLSDISKVLTTDDSSTAKKWFMLIFGNSFNEIEIKSKNFTVQRQSIIDAIRMCHMKAQIIKLSSMTDNLHHFGVYAVPNCFNKVFLGPYRANEDSDIVITKFNNANPVFTTHGYWLNSSSIVMINLLNSAYHKALQQPQNVDLEPTITKVKKYSNIKYITNNRVTCINGLWLAAKEKLNGEIKLSTSKPITFSGPKPNNNQNSKVDLKTKKILGKRKNFEEDNSLSENEEPLIKKKYTKQNSTVQGPASDDDVLIISNIEDDILEISDSE